MKYLIAANPTKINKIIMSKKILLAVVTIFFGINTYAQAPGCPNISVSSNDTLDCNNSCVRLGSQVLRTGQTTTYVVASVPYAPPFSFSGGTSLFVGTDDIWSGVLNIPFNFCFYGNMYNQLVVGANGVLSFNTSLAGATCPWSITSSVPSSALITNAIFGAYHDIDPSISTTGNINYTVIGTSPCRTFVVNYNHIYQFSCNSIFTTQQIVLYEATNVVEVYIQNKPTCSGWNSGNALIGLQNSTGTVGITPPGRNTGSWSASNEAWRFTPSGAPNYVINWYEGGALIGSGDSLTVCPNITTNYTAEVVYTNCDGNLILDSGDVMVYVSSDIMIVDPGQDTSICLGDSIVLGGDTVASGGSGTYTYSWTPTIGLSDPTIPNPVVTPTSTETYYLTVDDGVLCVRTDSIKVTVNDYPIVNAGVEDTLTCQNLILGLNGTTSIPGTYTWTTIGGNILSGASTTTPQVDEMGVYIFEVNNYGCKGSDTVDIAQDIIMPVVNAGTDTIITCVVDTIQLNGNVTPAMGTTVYYYWTGLSIVSGDSTLNPIINGPGTYVLTAVDTANSCQVSSNVVVVDGTNLPTVVVSPDADLTCLVTNLTLNGTGSTTGSTISYQWSTVDGTILTGSDSIIATTTSAGTYTLTVFNSFNSCSSSSNVVISLNNFPPIASAGIDTSLNCTTIGTGVPIDGTGSQAGINITYQWSTPDGYFVFGDGSNYALVNAAGTYIISVTNNATGCVATDTMQVSLDTDTPFVNAGTDTIITCVVDTIQLNGSATGNNLSYNWTGPSIVSGGSTLTPIISGSGTGNYTLTVTNNLNGCSSSDVVVVTSDVVPPGANAGILDTLCLGSQMSLTGTTSTGNAYLWTTSTGNIVSGDSTLTPTINSGGTYTLNTTNTANGCTSSANVVIQEIAVSAIIAADPTNGMIPLTVTFMNNGSADSSYWNFANGQTFGGTSSTSTSTIIYDTQGSYVVTLTSFNGQCSATTQVTIEVIGTSFLIVPNVFTPNGDNKNDVFEFIFQNITDLNCVIFNRWGKQVAEITVPDKSWDGNIGSSKASDGTYFYIIKATGLDDVSYDLKGTVTLVR